MSFWRSEAAEIEVTNLGQELQNSIFFLLQKIGLRYYPLYLALTMRDDSTNISLYLQMSHTSEEIHKNWWRLLAIVLNCAWIHKPVWRGPQKQVMEKLLQIPQKKKLKLYLSIHSGPKKKKIWKTPITAIVIRCAFLHETT